MSVKFKLSLNISHEEMIRMLAHYAPFEIIAVEEVIEHSTPTREEFIHSLHPPVKKLAKAKRIVHRRGDGPNLKTGINGIIVTHLSDGMGHPARELRKPLKAAGYSESSVASRLDALKTAGVIEKIGLGIWRLTDHTLPPSATTEAGRASK